MAKKNKAERRRLARQKKTCPYCGMNFSAKQTRCLRTDACKAGMGGRRYEQQRRAEAQARIQAALALKSPDPQPVPEPAEGQPVTP